MSARDELEKYFVAVEDGIDYARRHALYRDHPDLANASYALRRLRIALAELRSATPEADRAGCCGAG